MFSLVRLVNGDRLHWDILVFFFFSRITIIIQKISQVHFTLVCLKAFGGVW